MKKIDKLNLCAAIVLFGFCFSVILHSIYSRFLGLGAYWDTYLVSFTDIFSDFRALVVFNGKMDPFHTLFRTWGPTYPPFMFLFVLPFTKLGFTWGSAAYIVFYVVGFLWFIRKLTDTDSDPTEPKPSTSLKLQIFMVLGFLTFPFQFAFERLNAENLIFLCLAVFILLFQKNPTT